MLSASNDGVLQTGQADGTNKPICTEYSRLNCAAWSPDGHQIASAGYDGCVRLWRRGGTPGPMSPGTRNAVWAITCNPRAGQVGFSTDDDIVRIWRSDGTPDRSLSGISDGDRIRSMAWSPNGEQLATGRSGIIRLWKSNATAGPVLKGHQHSVHGLAWSPDGKQLASASWDKSVRLWSADGKSGPVLEGHKQPVFSVAWHPRGRQLASVALDGTLRFWSSDGTAGNAFGNSKEGYWLSSVSWSPNGEWLATGGDDVKLWHADGRPGPVLKYRWGQSEDTDEVSWSPDGRLLASAGHDATVGVWQSDGTRRLVLCGHRGAVRALTWADGGNRLLSGDDGGMVRMWNVEDGTTVWTAICLKENRHVTFSPIGEILHGHPKVIEDELVYLVEQPNRALEILKPSEFKQRAGR